MYSFSVNKYSITMDNVDLKEQYKSDKFDNTYSCKESIMKYIGRNNKSKNINEIKLFLRLNREVLDEIKSMTYSHFMRSTIAVEPGYSVNSIAPQKSRLSGRIAN